ncbi:MAG: hypothetical protein WC738_04325 [Candidatus Omnitrophota bacterium]|jgi:hypothetical protein
MPEAFGREVNSACIKAGQDLLKKTKEYYKSKKEAGHRDIEQASKDIATGLVGVGKKRIMLLPDKITIKNIMSNADRRARGWPEDESLEDYQGGAK